MEDIPNINPKTGLSKDYVKAFGPLNMYIRSMYGHTTTERIKKFSADNLVRFQYRFRTYQEWFKPEEFREVVTEKNRAVVHRLDEIVNELNDLVRQRKIADLSEQPTPRPLALFNEAMSYILGYENFDFKAICEKGDAEINKYFW